MPLPENRVTLDPEVRDQRGLHVARMEYTQCENDRKNIACGKRTLHHIFEAAKAQDVLVIDRRQAMAEFVADLRGVGSWLHERG